MMGGGGSGQRHAPATLPPGNPGTHCTVGAQGRSGRVRKISPPPVFEPQSVQPVASRNTNCAISAATYCSGELIKHNGRNVLLPIRTAEPFVRQASLQLLNGESQVKQLPTYWRYIGLKLSQSANGLLTVMP